MPTPILATKLYLPRLRPNVVSRPRLIERLNEGLHRKLTLISAPADFGRTPMKAAVYTRYGPPDVIQIKDVEKPVPKDMVTGKVTLVIDRRYSLSEVPKAIRYLEEGHARGKVVITVDQNDHT